MDFTYTPEQEQFRAEIRRWLAANLTDDLRIEDPTDERVAPDRETFERRRDWQRRMFAAGWVGISWPKEYGGRGATLMEQVIYDEECFRARAPGAPGLLRHRHGGADHHRVGHRGPEAALPAAHPGRRRHLVPGLLRAGRGLRPRGPPHPGGGAGRPLRGERAEGVDLGRPVRGLDLPARAHRSERAQASRHQLPAGRHEDAGHHGAPARAAQRPPPLQRSILRRRGSAEGQPDRPAERGLEARDDHPHVRAQGRRRPRPRGAARPAARRSPPGCSSTAGPPGSIRSSASASPSS